MSIPRSLQHPHRVRVQRLRMAAGATRLDDTAAESLGERLGDLRAGAVAGAQEQHPRSVPASASISTLRRWRREAQPRMQRTSGISQQLAATLELEQVVGVAPVGRAAPAGHQALGPKPTEVVGDEVLRQLEANAQLTNSPIAVREFAQQPPSDRVPR